MKHLTLWFIATRPKTLAASIFSVLLSLALAHYYTGSVHKLSAAICLGFGILCQILSNFANDYYDDIKGADKKRDKGPLRLVASGLIQHKNMYIAIWLVGTLAFIFGSILSIYRPWPIVMTGVITCIFFAILYTKGTFAIAYRGLGDIFVFIFFGLVSILGTFYMQTGFITADIIFLASAYGLMASNILALTSYRDIDTDKLVNKKTPGVRFGKAFVQWQYIISYLSALSIILIVYFYFNYPKTILLPWLSLPIAYYLIKKWKTQNDNLCFNLGLKLTVLLLVLYTSLLIIGLQF